MIIWNKQREERNDSVTIEREKLKDVYECSKSL
jgi:hypothetical protein